MQSVKTQTIPGTVVVLDETLEKRNPEKNLGIESTIEKLYQEAVVKDIQGEIKHNNYITYLIYAYRYHLGYVFSPDIYWHLIVSQLAKYVVDNAEDFRGLFNGNADGTKKELKVELHDINDMDFFCEKLIEQLKEEVFFDVEMFNGDFTTTTKNAKLNYMVGLLESGSPYYDYVMMLACGFPKVVLQGEVNDFRKIQEKTKQLRETFAAQKKKGRKMVSSYQSSGDLTAFFNNVESLTSEIIANYIKPTVKFWKGIIVTDQITQQGYSDLTKQIADRRAGIKDDKGKMEEELLHDYISSGWISRLNLNYGDVLTTINARLISKIDYTLVNHPIMSGKYTLYSGIFSSNLKDETLIPEFGWFVKPKSEKAENHYANKSKDEVILESAKQPVAAIVRDDNFGGFRFTEKTFLPES